jgi:homoserine kinase
VSAIRVRAPATTANLGPGFDCAAVALDLWNEMEVAEGGDGGDPAHLAVRAFALLAPTEGRTFAFVDRIPRGRGLGSSAAVIALGLVAGAVAAEIDPDPEALLAVGIALEGHGDNLAAALSGGVCLTWGPRIARIADRPPALPVAVVPDVLVSTADARTKLPADVPHTDAAFTAARAALLGAALASGSQDLFAAALHDRLHEPYRGVDAPLLGELRARPPVGSVGSTLSGSGPSVIVWATAERVEDCAAELRSRYPHTDVVPLSVATEGATSL